MMQKTTKRLGVWALLVTAVLMIPLIGKWPWTGSDFVFGAVMLFGSASVYEFATRKMTNPDHKVLVGIFVFIVLAVIWVGAATGFGTE